MAPTPRLAVEYPPFPDTKTGGLTLTLAPAADQPVAYRGTILRDGKRLPVTATAGADRLQGTFTNDGDEFEFTATTAGEFLK